MTGKKRNQKGSEPAADIAPVVIVAEGGQIELPLEVILPNPEQPRTEFDKAELESLAESIRENGVIQPVVVEPAGNGMYFLHAGERRTRAARMAGLKTIPAVITPALNGDGKEKRLVRALVENLQRSDMNVIEEAKGYQRMVDMGFTRNDIALKLGISSKRVVDRLDLLALEPEIQELISTGKLTKDARLVKALKEIPDSTARVKMAGSLSSRNATIPAGIAACKKIASVLDAEKLGGEQPPAMQLATRKAGPPNRAMWNAFSQVGKVPPWPLMEICVRDTCERCGLRDVASAQVCKGCALVELLAQMIGQAK